MLTQVTEKTKKQLAFIASIYFFILSDAIAQLPDLPDSLSGSVSGYIIDSASLVKLEHVTIEIYQAQTETAIRSTISDENGFFTLKGLLPFKQYNLYFTYAGYYANILQITVPSTAPIHLGQVGLASLAKQLQEVKVTSPKLLIEQNLEKLIYNMELDPESKTGSTLDILRKIPFLSVDADDNLKLNGHSNYQVLINGKSSSLLRANQSEFFKNLSASAIKTIEVITVPPSKYETQGIGGIINITTYKKTLMGYNGGMNVRTSDPKGLSANGNLSIRAGKFELSGNFGYTSSTIPVNKSSFLRRDLIRQNLMKQTGSSSGKNRSHTGGGEITYNLDDYNQLTAGYNFNKGRGTNYFIQLATWFDPLGDPAEAYRRLNQGENKQKGDDFYLDLQRTSRRNNDQQLKLSYKLNNSSNNNSSDFTVQPLLNQKRQLSTTDNKDLFREQVWQADYEQPIKKQTLELGASVIQRKSNSRYFYKDQDPLTGLFLLDSSQSNHFHYQENIYSGYASLNLRLSNWGLQAGARLEKAYIDAHFITSRTAAKQAYQNIVPSLTLSKQLKKMSTIRLSYAQRLQRPDLSCLDPYVDRTDPWNISYGNPGLQPALAHVVNLTYSTFFRKTSVTSAFFHQFTNNSIQQFTVLGADTIARTTFGNIGQNRNTSFSIGINTSIFEKLMMSFNGNTSYQQYSNYIHGKLHRNEGLTYNVSGGANLRVKTWRLSTNMSYNAPNVLVQGKTASYTSHNATVNKYFLRTNKANISLSVTSLFREHRRSFTEINDPTFYLWRESLSVIRRYNLSFNYRFIKVQGSENRKREK